MATRRGSRSLLGAGLFALAAIGGTVAARPAGQTAPLIVELGLEGDLSAMWELVTDPPTPIGQVCVPRADGVIAVAGTPIGYIATKGIFHEYRVHAEWRWTDKPGNGGALVHITTGPKDRQWPVCFQVQWKHGAAGDLLPMAGATFAEALTTPPGAATPLRAHAGPDSERPVGDWNTCEIVCARGAIEVSINGVAQNRVSGLSASEGKVGFQLEGTPFEMRRVKISPLR
jgi:hypothetical protein